MQVTDRSRAARWMPGCAAALLLLTGCSGDDAGEKAAAAPSNETLAGLVSSADELSTVAATLKDAGLAQVFDGVAAYTLLAPRDTVFDSLGEAGATLRSVE